MTGVRTATMPHALDDPRAARMAGRELLSLALIDSRNALLARLAQAEDAAAAQPSALPAVLRLALAAGAWQERGTAPHPQRQRGEEAAPGGPLLAAVEPPHGRWHDAEGVPPDAAEVRA
ncbi:MAG: hypothetical protein ACK5V2_06595, partial [Pseudomonadota bacterium]